MRPPSIPSARGRRIELRVEQTVDRRRDVGVGRDHAGLLQGEPGSQDRLGLRRADGRLAEVRALDLPAMTGSGSFVAATSAAFSASGFFSAQARASS